MSNFKTPILYGIIAFALMCLFGYISSLIYKPLFSSHTVASFYVFVAFGSILFMAIWAGVTVRRNNGGNISFVDAFLSAFIVCSFALVGLALMTYLLPNVIDQQKPAEMLAYAKEITRSGLQMEKVAEAEITKRVNEMTIDAYKPSMEQVIMGLGSKLLGAGVICLLLAAFIRRNLQLAVDPREQTSSSN